MRFLIDFPAQTDIQVSHKHLNVELRKGRQITPSPLRNYDIKLNVSENGQLNYQCTGFAGSNNFFSWVGHVLPLHSPFLWREL